MGSILCCCVQPVQPAQLNSNNNDTEYSGIPLDEIDYSEPYNRRIRPNQHIRGDVVDFHRTTK